MEDPIGAASDGTAPPPFSGLIRDWLDEGDRLDEKAAATAAAIVPAAEGRLRRTVARLRPAFDRYRLFVLAGVGLIPFALFTATHHGAAAPAVPMAAVATVSLALPTPTPAVAPARPGLGAATPELAAPAARPAVGTRTAAVVRPSPRAKPHPARPHPRRPLVAHRARLTLKG